MRGSWYDPLCAAWSSAVLVQARSPELAVALFLAVLFSACGGSSSDLQAIPQPTNLQEMSSAVRKQYSLHRGRLDKALEDRSVKTLVMADAYGEMGLWFHAYQLSHGALASYLNARQLAPESARWAYYLGVLYSSLGRTDEARGEFEAFLRLKPGDVAALVRLAELELAAGRADSAEVLLHDAVAQAPECARAMVGLAAVLEGRGDHAGATDWLARAAEHQPESQQIRYALALSYRRVGELERAAALLAFSDPQAWPDVRMVDPLANHLRDLDVGLHGNLRRARRAIQNGRQEAGLRFFRRALDADATSTEAWLGAARSLDALGRLGDSVDELSKALSVLPENSKIRTALASHLVRFGRDAEAREHFEEALAIDPDSRSARRGLGDLLVAENDLEGAARLFAQLRSSGLTPELASRHGLTLIRLGRYAEARRSLEEDLLRLGQHRKLELLLARLLATAPAPQVRDGRRALELARAVFESSPGLDAAEIVVMGLAETGRFEAAVSAQEGLLRSVERAGRSDLLPSLELRLRQFQSREACRDPLPDTETKESIFVAPGLLAD